MKQKSITLAAIENSGPDNLRDTLKQKLAKSNEVSIAVAFVTQAGLDEIIQPLRQVAARGKVWFITGIYQHVTEPRALYTLLKIQNETGGRFSVALSTEARFHRKLYFLKSRDQATLLIGSSNLTREGMQSAGELNVMLSLPQTDNFYQDLKRIFEQEWEQHAVVLEPGMIERYEKAWEKATKSRELNKSEVKKILGVPTTHRPVTPVQEPPNFWRDCIQGEASKRTERIISESTNWYDRGFFWYSAGGKHNYKIGDQILLFDKTDDTLKHVKVVDIARTKVPTPDGRNFIAYQYFRGFGKRLTKTFRQALKNVGIGTKSIDKRVRLSEEASRELLDLIRIRHPKIRETGKS